MREKAKQLVTLLKDEERLREERIHALKTKEKMAQTSSGEMTTHSRFSLYLILQYYSLKGACSQEHKRPLVLSR